MADQLEAVAQAWEKLLEDHRAAGESAGVALALPFLVDTAKTRVLGEFGKFPGATEIDFGAWSRQRLGLPLALENDLRVALLGEWLAGAARGKQDIVMFALGTGIGCAVVTEGRLLRGANQRAASLFGHGTLAYAGPVGRCGNLGCAEDLASTATLADRARQRPDFAGSTLERAGKIDFQTVFTLAASEDPCAAGLLQQSLQVWAALVQNAVLAYDPELVVLGGGVLRRADVILPAITRHLAQYMPSSPLQVPVVAAALGDDAALLGGEVLLRQTHPHLFP